jgi:hypothetical protein
MWLPDKDIYEQVRLVTVNTFVKNSEGSYPYMDTFKWFFTESGYLVNSQKYLEGDRNEDIYFMEDTDGTYHVEGRGKYVPYYDDYIDEDNLTWCAYGGEFRLHDDAFYLPDEEEHATEEYAGDNCVYVEDHGYILKENAVKYIDAWDNEQYSTREHVEKNYYWCEEEDMWYEEASWSEHYQTYLPYDKSKLVFIKDDLTSIIDENNEGSVDQDYRMIDDDTYFDYHPRKKEYKNDDGERIILFDNDLKNNFVLAIIDWDSKTTDWFHKEYDKDLFQDYKGQWVETKTLKWEDLI